MKICAVICEYNPFHSGHAHQINQIKKKFDRIICIMSGNFTQRANPAIFDKYFRARQAVLHGADMVLQLPTPYVVSSAENFAKGAINALKNFPISAISMGMENADVDLLESIISTQLSKEYSSMLKTYLKTGISYASANVKAVCELNNNAKIEEFFCKPNNILALEYAKAIKRYNLNWQIFPIERQNNYNDENISGSFASATAIRKAISNGETTKINSYVDYLDDIPYLPKLDENLFNELALYSIKTSTIDKVKHLADSHEGIENKLIKNALVCTDLTTCEDRTKSKRYTHARIRRIILQNLLDIKKTDIIFPDELKLQLLAVSKTFSKEMKEFSHLFYTTGKDSLDEKISPFTKIEERAEKLYSTLTHTSYNGVVKKLEKI